jgi:transcriptional regulator with XRE-family HTH domain
MNNYQTQLQEILTLTGWTQDHLSDLLDVSYPALNHWLKGTDIPHETNATKIEKVYKLLQYAHREATEEVEKKILREKIEKLDENNS